MKSVFNIIRNLFKPKFKASKDDLLILKGEKAPDNLIKEPLKPVPELKSNSDFFKDIYNEAKEKTELSSFHSGAINFKELKTYSLLLSQKSKFKVSFLYFLIHRSQHISLDYFYAEPLFEAGLFDSLLATNLSLNNRDIDRFFLFSQLIYSNYSTTPALVLLNKVVDISNDNKHNNALVATLNAYISRTKLSSYKRLHKEMAKIYRLLTDYKFKNEKLPFFLIEDNFGEVVNKMLLRLDQKKAEPISKILAISSVKRSSVSKSKKIEKLIEEIGYDFFLGISLEILQTASSFKNKIMANIRYGKREVGSFGMFYENLVIVYGLLKTLETKNLLEKIPVEIITLIAKRSYTLKQEIRLSQQSTKVGHLCVKLLALNYGEEGKNQLKEVYENIPYKRVRKAIDEVLKASEN